MLFRILSVLMFMSLATPVLAAEVAPTAPTAPMTAPMAAPVATPPAAMSAPAVVPGMAAGMSAPVAVPAMAPVPGMAVKPVVPAAPTMAPVPVKAEPVASDAPADPLDDPAVYNRTVDATPVVDGVVPAVDATKIAPVVKVTPPPVTVKVAPGDSWWKGLLGGMTNILLLFLSAIATGLGALLIKWVAGKIKVTDAVVLAAVEAQYDKAVQLGIDYAEQEAKKLTADPDAKGKRIGFAIAKIQELIQDQGLVEKTADWIRVRIEAKLGQQNRSKSSVSSS
jgi:hypothetical protein